MKTEKRYLVPSDYMADPAVHVFDGKLYIYPSHDWESGIAENDNGENIGYAIYYPIFSSFSANVKAHLEDLFIKPNFRHQGYGKEFFFKIAKIIKDEGYIEIEWSCLDWNTPSIEFYKKIGAIQEKGRVYFGYKLNN